MILHLTRGGLVDFCLPSINSTARNKQEPPLRRPGQTLLINPSTAFSCLSSRELELQLRVSQRSPVSRTCLPP